MQRIGKQFETDRRSERSLRISRETLPAVISASSTALAPSPSNRLTWLTMPAQINALP